MAEYKYRIIDTGSSSARLGECEVCGEYVASVHYQVEQRAYSLSSCAARRRGCAPGSESWTHHDCRSLFGHLDCLLGARRSAVSS